MKNGSKQFAFKKRVMKFYMIFAQKFSGTVCKFIIM